MPGSIQGLVSWTRLSPGPQAETARVALFKKCAASHDCQARQRSAREPQRGHRRRGEQGDDDAQQDAVSTQHSIRSVHKPPGGPADVLTLTCLQNMAVQP